jgi:hypothetical protein
MAVELLLLMASFVLVAKAVFKIRISGLTEYFSSFFNIIGSSPKRALKEPSYSLKLS